MENKKLRQKIATRLINEDLGFLEKFAKRGWFSAGIKLTRQQIIDGLINFMLEMVARDEPYLSRQELRERILRKLKEVSLS